jgi:hypothetical protein
VGQRPLTCTCGPKGIRTPDLLAASQNRVNGVLPSVFAGRNGAKAGKLWGVVSPHPASRHDALVGREVVGRGRDALEEWRMGFPDSPAVGTGPRRDVDRLSTLGNRARGLFGVGHGGTVAARSDRAPPRVSGPLILSSTTTLTVVNDGATYFTPSWGYNRSTGVSRREEHVGDEDQLAVQRGVARD